MTITILYSIMVQFFNILHNKNSDPLDQNWRRGGNFCHNNNVSEDPLDFYKLVNNGWISNFKVFMEASFNNAKGLLARPTGLARPEGPPALGRSKKEGGHRLPEPSCSKNYKNFCHSFNCGQIKPEGIFKVFRGLYWKFWNDSLKQHIHMLL